MSPEQSQGEKVDHRADIWSLGVMFYEMVSGQLPFKGEYESAIIYSIMNENPEPLTAVRTGVPMKLEEIVNKLLAKEPDERYQNIVELPVDLKNVSLQETDTSQIGSSAISGSLNRKKEASQKRLIATLIPWVITTVAVGIALIVLVVRESPDPPQPLTASLNFEEHAGPIADRHLALSPDGSQLAYVTSTRFDESRVWIRNLADGNMRPLLGTEGAERPFWAPDGSMIGYFAEQELRVVPAKGGPSIVLATAPRPSGGTWSAHGVILYNPAHGPLFQIPAAGGTATQVTQITRMGEWDRNPIFLPDAQQFLFWKYDENNVAHIYKSDLETKQVLRLREGSDPKYVESGFLLFRLGNDLDVASVFAQRFDPERNAMSGQPIPVLSDVVTPYGEATLSVTNRTIVFARDTQIPNSFWWRNHEGIPLDTIAHREYTWVYRVSHNGTRVAFAGEHLWVHDLVREISERIPTGVTFPVNFAWSPDDSSIVYSNWGQLRVVQVIGSVKEDVIFQSDKGNIESPEWSPDGRTILFVFLPDESRALRELWAFDTEEGKASPVLASSYNVFNAIFAPNGQWYAYTSDEGGGNRDVYLRHFPGPGSPIRVSVDGGVLPRWRRDGRELFYVNGDGRLAAVRIEFEGRPSAQRTNILPGNPITSNPYINISLYDVHPDGQRFLLQQDYGLREFSQLTILRNWIGMLDERQ